MKTQGEIEAAICEGMSRFEQEYMGRGPKDIHTFLLSDLCVVRLRGVLTAAEQHLSQTLPPDKGRDLLKQVRFQLVETARPTLKRMMYESTGVKVLSLHHGDRDGVREGSGPSAPGPRRNLFLRRLAVSSAREQRYAAMYHDGREAVRSKWRGPEAKLVKRQRTRYSFIGMLLLVSYHVFLRVSHSQPWFGDDWLGVWTAGGVIVAVAFIVWLMVIEHRLKNRVVAANNRICPNCGYSLVGHDAEGACPECGDAFTPSSLEMAWRGIRRCPKTFLRKDSDGTFVAYS